VSRESRANSAGDTSGSSSLPALDFGGGEILEECAACIKIGCELKNLAQRALIAGLRTAASSNTSALIAS
jgi:hypothetical protein